MGTLAHNFVATADGYRAEFPAEQVIIDMVRWRDERGGASCQIAARCAAPTAPEYVISPVRWNLTSLVARRELVKYATARWDRAPWADILELCARLALERREAGEPVVMIGVEDVTSQPTYAQDPLLLSGQINVLYGKPGSLKGWLALAMALDVQEGFGLLGLPTPDRHRPVLYLDFEYDQATQARRIQALCAGAGKPRVNLAYLRCAGHLADQIERIAREVTDLEIKVGIVDSVEAAIGATGEGDPAGPIKRLTQALRSIPITWLEVDHDTKGAERGRETPYGSRFKQAWSRNTWLIRKAQERPGEASIGLWHDATSNTGPRPPFGYRVTFDGPAEAPTRVIFKREDPRDVAGFADLLTDWQKIERQLNLGPLPVKTLAEDIGKSEAVIRARLNEKEKCGVTIHLPDGRWALADRAQRT